MILVGSCGVGKTALQEKFLSPENSQFYESVYGNYHTLFLTQAQNICLKPDRFKCRTECLYHAGGYGVWTTFHGNTSGGDGG